LSVLDTVVHLQGRTSPHRFIFGPRESDRPGRSSFGHMFAIGIIVGDIEDKPCLSDEGDGIGRTVEIDKSPRFVCYAQFIRNLSFGSFNDSMWCPYALF